MDAVFYWDMTYKEILAAIKGKSKRQEAELQYQSIIAYHQANLISHLVGISLGSKQNPQALHEAFPGVFPELEKQAQLQLVKQQNWQIMKARIDAYAAEKRKRGEKNGDDN
ncbi:hypothetical protein CSE16_11915 [Solibacillus sp. R5-41]|uniref:hypothetical protein n=1 Tax=Solibacillus sp. R5-41 TaxID=2048654 RepID=UPI000C126E2D|nr:hypothetical protein [Solibacillus sp. R5-41]ATP40697.1 hypothetical protein CSE16_11915 [Solibacillus sp. R5-41]